MKRILFLITCLMLAPTLPLSAREPSRGKIKRFVTSVSLGPEYGDAKRVVSRWTTAPTVSVFGASEEQKALVAEVLGKIGPLLQPSLGEIQMLPDGSNAATMRIHFGTQDHLSKVALDRKIVYNKNDWGFFWMFWNERNEITSSIILLATDKLTAKNALRHYAYEEIIQSFGLAQDSDEFPDSIFFAKGDDGGRAAAPSALDLRLLEWFHKHLNAGDNPRIVSEKFDATWSKDE